MISTCYVWKNNEDNGKRVSSGGVGVWGGKGGGVGREGGGVGGGGGEGGAGMGMPSCAVVSHLLWADTRSKKEEGGIGE